MLSVKSDLPVHDVGELIAYTKANPGKLSIAFDNTAGAAAYAAKLLNKRAGLNLVEVPYRSSPQAVQDTSAGVAQLLMSSIAAARPGVESGKLRRLAVTSRRRFPGLPELPTLQESVPGVVMDGFFAVVAPNGTASEIVRKMNVAIGHYLAGSEIRDRLLAFGLATDGGGTPESTAQVILEEQKDWRVLATELSIEPQ
jgi:tripartite-type tricarboxylate transporter receptor subunit TctC